MADPSVTFDNIRRFEDHHMTEALKRREEIKAIDAKMNEIRKRSK